MSATQARISRGAIDTLRELTALADIIKDPSQIATAHNILRSEFALTDSEQEKADAARAFIKEHETLLSSLKDKETIAQERIQLDNDIAQHSHNVNEHNIANAKVIELAAELKERLEGHNAILTAHNDAIKAFEEEKASALQDNLSATKFINDKTAQLADLEKSLLEDKARVAEKEKELNDKHETLKAILGK